MSAVRQAKLGGTFKSLDKKYHFAPRLVIETGAEQTKKIIEILSSIII